MASGFRELDYQETPLGAISLRQRPEPRLGGQLLFEVQLGDEFLMSSLFTEAEIQLSKLALRALADRNADERDIVVGGLGLGYTALAALAPLSVFANSQGNCPAFNSPSFPSSLFFFASNSSGMPKSW